MFGRSFKLTGAQVNEDKTVSVEDHRKCHKFYVNHYLQLLFDAEKKVLDKKRTKMLEFGKQLISLKTKLAVSEVIDASI